MSVYGHPVYSRYPHLIVKTAWEKVFIVKPRKTVSGKTVFCRYVYKRTVIDQIEYETKDNIVMRKLAGED